jgi:hypothetical protein
MAALTELTTEELERLIESVVRRTMDDYLEDLQALASPGYRASIAEAREDYRAGRVERLEDLEDG